MSNIAKIILHSSEASDDSDEPPSHNINLYYNKKRKPWPISSSDFYQIFFNSKNRLLKEFSFPTALGFINDDEIKYTMCETTKTSDDIEDMLTLSKWYYCKQLQVSDISCNTTVVLDQFNISDVLIKQWKKDIKTKNIDTTITTTDSDGKETTTTTTTTYESPIREITEVNNVQTTIATRINNSNGNVTTTTTSTAKKTKKIIYPSSNILVRNELMSQNTLYNLKFNTKYQTSLSWYNLLQYLDGKADWKGRCDWESLQKGDELVIIINFSNKNKFAEDIAVCLNFKIS